MRLSYLQQTVDVVSMHKFKVGEAVSFVSGLLSAGDGGSYTVTRLLPPIDEEFQYRIKSDRERFERVAPESQLDRAAV